MEVIIRKIYWTSATFQKSLTFILSFDNNTFTHTHTFHGERTDSLISVRGKAGMFAHSENERTGVAKLSNGPAAAEEPEAAASRAYNENTIANCTCVGYRPSLRLVCGAKLAGGHRAASLLGPDHMVSYF